MNEEDRDKITDSGPKDIPTNAVGRYTRSTPLVSTVWMTGVLVWATVIGFLFHVPTWAGIFLSSLTGLSFLLYMVSYIYLMATSPEALRRERYVLKELREREPALQRDARKDRAILPGPEVIFPEPLIHETATPSKERTEKIMSSRSAASEDV